MPLTAGQRLGAYEILGALGAGGMGEVYRAKDTKLGRDVAVKVLPEIFASDPERMARFDREAKVLASLNHPNIAQIYGVEDNAFIMELVEGETVHGPLPPDEALRLAEQIADALAAAHEKGITHRDLKPGNIMITSAGVVKVLDFGLAAVAQAADSNSSASTPTLTMSPTRAGMILGTAAYMAPEQARGKPVDRRADIWAFGAVLYEMLTGRKLFEGETVSDVLAGVLAREPDLTSVPPALRRLLAKCLEKDPKRRLQAIGDWRLLLEPPAEAPAAAPPPARASRLPWIVAAALAVAAAGFAALWLRPAPLPRVTRFEIHAPSGSTLPLGTPAPSPDGRTLAYTVRDPDGMTRIHLRPIDRIETRALPGTENAVHPFWSPDGRSLAFATRPDNRLKRIDVEGGAPRDLTILEGPWHGGWNQYGDILFQPSTVARISADGGSVTPVVSLDAKKGEGGAGFPLFLPDGKRFLLRVQGNQTSIQLATLGSMERTLVLNDVDSAPLLAPTPRGKTYLLYLRASDLLAQEFDPPSGTVRGSPVVVVSNIGRVANPAVRPAMGVSPSGVLAYQAGGDIRNGQLTWFDRSGKPLDSLPADASGTSPELSPDGRAVAVGRIDSSGTENLWVTDLARKSAVRLTFEAGRNFSPVWSPDGKRLALVCACAKPGLRVIDADGSARPEPAPAGRMAPTSWSPDGRYLLASMALVPLTGDAKPIPVGSRNGRSGQGRFSPDGRYIAFTSRESGRAEIYVQPVPPATGQTKISINGGLQPRWRRDGKELFFVSLDGSMMAADLQLGPTVSAGVPRQLFRVDGLDLTGYDVRADGQQFLVFTPSQSTQSSVITVVQNWWVEWEK
ncbi:MAG: protein kinase [Acidobacteriia bacterium]|nr:protein kinase [Terriglobia bacterium]